MEFSEKIADELVRIDFSAACKDDALRKIAELAATSPILKEIGAETLLEKLREREESVSTGIGGGIAIPHARIRGIDDFVVFVLVAPKGVDFDALDKRKVQIFFVVFAPEEEVNEQLKILASISRAMSQENLKREVLQTTSREVLLEVLGRASNKSPSSDSGTKEARKKLMFVILYYEEDMREVLEFLLDQGIAGATIINSQGMGAFVSSMPLFASFLGFMREDRNTSNIVMTLIPADDEPRFVNGIEQITGDLDKKQGAMIISLDISFHKGTMNMI